MQPSPKYTLWIVSIASALLLIGCVSPLTASPPTPDQRTYPRIPLPAGITLSGVINVNAADQSDFSFYLAAPTDIAAFYAEALTQQGWHVCTGAACDFGS